MKGYWFDLFGALAVIFGLWWGSKPPSQKR